jgi:hypothetical protein
LNKLDRIDDDEESAKIIPWHSLIVILIIAIVTPFQIIFVPEGYLQIISQVWVFFPFSGYFELFGFLSMVSILPFCLLRYLLAIQVGRFFKGETTQQKTIIIGIVGEIPVFILSLLLFLQPFVAAIPFTISIPVPLTLIISLYLVRRYTKPEYPLTWKGEKKILDWWPEIDIPENKKSWQ